MTVEKTQEIEEMSTVAGGTVEAASAAATDDEQEQEERLRTIIREAIRVYAARKKELSEEVENENIIREAVRNILLAEKESKDPAPTSTLEGVMRSLLNNIVPQIRLDYMKLQTNDDERQGFKDYFYNAVSQTIDITHDQMNPDETDKELAEQDTVVLKSDSPDFIQGVSDGTDSEEKKAEDKEENKTNNISSYYDRGQNFGETAFNAIKDRIENAVYSQIVPEEYDEFVKVLNANLEAWFKIWDSNRTKQDIADNSAPEETPDEIVPDTEEQPEDLGLDDLDEDFEIVFE